ncbi:kinesin-like protein KIF14 isoform X1 [Astyanax mexicanus]|uniref:Kinesin-like protein KIF14 n=1 Tax=Astyanax mexicanus TaxID=7994 RepID=A0A8T2L7L9_ASTMX|nr:kinesin-like protein KIF14 isoform X1 [Astyanax mexicanus]
MDALKGEETSCSLDKSNVKEINKTYIISALNKSAPRSNASSTSFSGARLTLQRRKTNSKGPELSSDLQDTENQSEPHGKRLTLQRRTRAGSVDKGTPSADEKKRAWVSSAVLSEPNSARTPGRLALLRSASLRDTESKRAPKDLLQPPNTPCTTAATEKSSTRPAQTAKVNAAHDQAKASSTPTGKTQFEKLSLKKEVFERLATRDVPKPVSLKQHPCVDRSKHSSTDSGKPQASSSKKVPLINNQSKNLMMAVTPRSTQVRKTTAQTSSTTPSGTMSSTKARPPTTSETLLSTEGKLVSQAATHPELKMEDSAVTVAVRVRPFSSREKGENSCQVIFMDNQETVVQHPDTKQTYTFAFDFSFCSLDEMDPRFASQQTVYENLAKPLLERAFEGFNTCLFAYGQTGSGKSYTMMGFGEEAGIIPRFCEELFLRLSRADSKEDTCHLEMSYFEVYNEKIHDLLVAKDEQNQKKMPLRVREHPVEGPYVEDLSTNVVSSYGDIQTWLELGNKQRATAATGMNDKSSRSHSVFTLVMTQTKTELVEGEEHVHRIISRINLVDLAGSERCATAQTSGDRLREGASINKSLLTLGKVISALSEQAQSRKKVFIPYRESVLTWLLKESLGGNSKTAMIATLSPAASNVDETLSTLRYAQQARLIINVAKVNEDTNAKLIRELKAEVEKLRAAQMSSQGIHPEKMRQFQQEITALKSQLSRQEREMAEVHRSWKEKLEQAEWRKREETKELQRVGITFKVDNRLPNLVNLNEDPQLSEMLLYMIKEGQTKVGKLKSESAHDIQLSGALIADEHCVISNINGTVSITPMKNAKTFVNGILVSEATVLHHGDRVILGGDHYFRFNHPAEVQSGKRASCWSSGDVQKDFEFAKNELLSAQRAQLEAEIEDARLKAKEEMMQGIQVAKEMAQKELFDQKLQYEHRIKSLERELEQEGERKRAQELERKQVASKMEELQTAKTLLEQEMNMHKKRLQMETQATRQAMADNDIRHAKILEALESEKRKIAGDLAEIQRKRALKSNHTSRTGNLVPPQWDAMKLSLMIEEANKISGKFRKHTVFSRNDVTETESGNGGNAEMQIQVQNTKLGISTFWSLEKFQSSLVAMRELEEGNRTSQDDDVFYDPNDQWEPDISSSSSTSSSSFSRRRSRSLLKSRRISGRLYEIRVHPIQSLNCTSSQSAGLMGMSKPHSHHSSSLDSTLPGICKDLIAAMVSHLRASPSAEENKSLADKLTLDLLSIHNAANSIASLYEQLDDNSQDNLFACSTDAQTHLVRATSAIERAVFITMHWIANIQPSTQSVSRTAEELKTEVKNMGSYFQLLIQGCDSEISSMVTEAQRKSARCLDAALIAIGLLATVTGTHLHLSDLGSDSIGRRPAVVCVREGMCRGVRALLEEGLSVSREMLKHAQLAQPRAQILQSLKMKMLDVAKALQSYIHCNMSEKPDCLDNSSEDDTSHLESIKNTANKLFQLNQAVQQLHSTLSRTLRGRGSDAHLSSLKEAVQSLTKTIDDIVHGLPRQTDVNLSVSLQLPCSKSIMAARDAVHLALCSLAAVFDESMEENMEMSNSNNIFAENQKSGYGTRNEAIPKVVYSLSSGVSSCSTDIRWV